MIFLDLWLPDSKGMRLLAERKRRWEQAEVVIITGYGSIGSAVEAIRKGAYHYLTKPLKLEDVRLLANRTCFKRKSRRFAGENLPAPQPPRFYLLCIEQHLGNQVSAAAV